MIHFTNEGKNKIETICFLKNNLRFFEELQKELQEQFKELFKNNKYSLIDTTYFIIDNEILSSLKEKTRNNTNYTLKGYVKSDAEKKIEKLTINELAKNISFFINKEKSTNNILYLDKEKVNEIFEDFTNITFKNPLIEAKELLNIIKSYNERKIDNEEGTLKFLTKKIKTNLRIQKNFSLASLEINNTFKYSKDKKIFNENNDKFLLLNEFSNKLKLIIEENIKPLKIMNKELIPLMKQLENRTNLILNIIESEKSYNKKLEIIQNFYKEITAIKTLFESSNKNKSFSSVFEIRYNFLIHFLEPLLTAIDINVVTNTENIEKLKIQFNKELSNLFKNIGIILNSIEDEEEKIKQKIYLDFYKNKFKIYYTDNGEIKNKKLNELNNFLEFGEYKKIDLTKKVKTKDISEEFEIIQNNHFNNLLKKIIEKQKKEKTKKINIGLSEEQIEANKKEIKRQEEKRKIEKEEKNKIEEVIKNNINYLLNLINNKEFNGYIKLLKYRKKINANVEEELNEKNKSILKYIDYREKGEYFQEYIKWLLKNINLDNLNIFINNEENKLFIEKKTYIKRKIINGIKRKINIIKKEELNKCQM